MQSAPAIESAVMSVVCAPGASACVAVAAQASGARCNCRIDRAHLRIAPRARAQVADAVSTLYTFGGGSLAHRAEGAAGALVTALGAGGASLGSRAAAAVALGEILAVAGAWRAGEECVYVRECVGDVVVAQGRLWRSRTGSSRRSRRCAPRARV